MNGDTTTIDSLPLSPQTENIRVNINEENIKVNNPIQSLNQTRDNDPSINQKNLNQFVSGIQQASAAGMTSLPSRDIPTNQQHLSQDANIQPITYQSKITDSVIIYRNIKQAKILFAIMRKKN